MSWGIVASVGGSLVGGILSSNASEDAASTQAQSAADSTALQKQMYDQTRQDNMPLVTARNNALAQYQQMLPGLMQPFTGANLASDPGYQFGLNQGAAALDNSAANRGNLYSGSQLKATQQFGNDYASTKFNEAFNRNQATNSFDANQLQSLIGIGQTGANQVAASGTNYANTASQNITGAGNARASGYIGGANAINGAIGQGVNAYQQNSLLSLLGNNQQQNQYFNNAGSANLGGNLGGW